MKDVFAIIFVLAALVLLESCGSSVRHGVGPYDFTDYDMLDARQEMREMEWELTHYPDPYDLYEDKTVTDYY